MDDIVARQCQVYLCEVGIIFNPNEWIPDDIKGHFCGKPATEYVDYGEDRVWMCPEHHAICLLGPEARQPGQWEIHDWKYRLIAMGFPLSTPQDPPDDDL